MLNWKDWKERGAEKAHSLKNILKDIERTVSLTPKNILKAVKKTVSLTPEVVKRTVPLTNPVHVIPVSFLAAIAVGTLLLLLPFSTVEGQHTDILTALFTATTSVCVTGLVVVDTFAHWTWFGQVVILLLIQVGGLGIITVSFLVMLLLQKKFSLSEKTLLQDSFNIDTSVGILEFLRKAVCGTLIIEGSGAVCFCIPFIRRFGLGKGVWAALFHSVSAFCNAGIDVMGPDSLGSFRSDPFVLGITMLLIIVGGLGYVVWMDLAKQAAKGVPERCSLPQRFRRLQEHTRLVLVMTFVLIAAGTILFYILERGNPDTWGSFSAGGRILNSLFESVTLRTAGFAVVPQENLGATSCLLAYLLMFIGGSPVSTAGGVKTVTFFLVVWNVFSYVRGKRETILFGRRVSGNAIQKAAAIIFVAAMTLFLFTALLLIAEPVSLTDGLFEMTSALCTVGLTRGVTPHLGMAGRLLVTIAMYLGRIGPISMAIFFLKRDDDQHLLRHAEGKFYVG